MIFFDCRECNRFRNEEEAGFRARNPNNGKELPFVGSHICEYCYIKALRINVTDGAKPFISRPFVDQLVKISFQDRRGKSKLGEIIRNFLSTSVTQPRNDEATKRAMAEHLKDQVWVDEAGKVTTRAWDMVGDKRLKDFAAGVLPPKFGGDASPTFVVDPKPRRSYNELTREQISADLDRAADMLRETHYGASEGAARSLMMAQRTINLVREMARFRETDIRNMPEIEWEEFTLDVLKKLTGR